MMTRISILRPYIFAPRGIVVLLLFELHNQKIITSPREAISAIAMAMMAIMALALLLTKPESGEDVAIYNP